MNFKIEDESEVKFHESENYKQYRGRFYWETIEGRVMHIDEMQTSHIFNCMKMLYNHLAAEHGYKTVWFRNIHLGSALIARKKPEILLKNLIFMLMTIEFRGNLPTKYQSPYYQIKMELLRMAGVSFPIQEAVGYFQNNLIGGRHE